MGFNGASELKPYGKPAFTGNAGINVRPVKPLTLSLDYCIMTGLYAHFPSMNLNPLHLSTYNPDLNFPSYNEPMKDIHDLRFRASWQFSDRFSLYAQFNNLLFQQRSMYYGYPMQPFSAMAGFNFNF
jgi:hypothetical protein